VIWSKTSEIFPRLLKKQPTDTERGCNFRQLMPSVRARFVRVVPGLKPVPRVGDRARGWLQSRHDPSLQFCGVTKPGCRNGAASRAQ